MTGHTNQPDWNRIAEKFDVWLPQLAPVGEALLTALNARPGDQILDVASGTGEPALTLAKRLGNHVQIVGTDAAQAMVEVARRKAQREHLSHVEFRCMSAEHLQFPDDQFDRVLCRFGVMLFDDPVEGLREMHRVLKPGGRFAFAVWHSPESMPTLRWSWEAFRDKIPPQHYPPVEKITSLGGPGVLEQVLDTAGYRDYKIELQTFDYRFPSFEAYWDAVEASDILKQQYDALPPSQRATIRDEVALLARDFHTPNGLAIPHRFLLASGNKPGT